MPLVGSLTFVIDETLERRWGRRINKRGHYRDPLASSRKAFRQYQWAALGRADSGCHAAMDDALLGLAHPRIKSGAGFERTGTNPPSQ